jgi:hypothetical protein
MGFTAHTLPILANWAQFLSGFAIFGGLAGIYHHLACSQEGCHRLGRFRHGHLKLCHVHHPHVPSNGKVDAISIRAETLRQLGPGPH